MGSRYVRPNTSHSASRDGLTYATAWGGWSEVVWGSSGVKGGDELFVCGAHTLANNISVGAHGATANAPVTIRGDYVGDPGSITFTTTTHTLTVGVAYTTLLNLSIAACFHLGAATNCKYLNCTFNTPNTTSGIRFATGGDNHSDVEIRGCTFNTIAASGTNHAALRWHVQTAQTSTMTRCTIENNTFNTQASYRSIIEFRTQADSNAISTMTDIKVNYNLFQNYKGTAVDLTCPGTSGLAFHAKGVQIRGNRLTNGQEIAAGTLGGGLGCWGFGPSTTPTFGPNLIADNYATNIQGPTGFIDVFYGSYVIQDNVGSLFYPASVNTIDANGILLDIGTTNTIVRRNKISNMNGSASFNSGVGLMILGKVTNCYVYGNVFDTMKNGIFVGATEGACDVKIYNNVFTNCTDTGVITVAQAALFNNVVCANNIFTGTGYAVKNQATGVTWNKENFNRFAGFSSGNIGHTRGIRSKTISAAVATAYASAISAGIDADALNSFLTLPATLLQLS